MRVLDSLRALSAFPISVEYAEQACMQRGVDAQAEATAEILSSGSYQLCKADVFSWLVLAPSISQGGISFALTEEQRQRYKREADHIYNAFGQSKATNYGYKGTKL